MYKLTACESVFQSLDNITYWYESEKGGQYKLTKFKPLWMYACIQESLWPAFKLIEVNETLVQPLPSDSPNLSHVQYLAILDTVF